MLSIVCSVCGATGAGSIPHPETPLLICEACFVRLFLP
jgi:hypothetical protein